MNAAREIILSLTIESKKDFMRYLRQRNKRNDTKNVELFQLLNSNTSLKEIPNLLYGSPSPGAYHALSKRLHDSLIDFVAAKNFEKESSKEMMAMKLLMAGSSFLENRKIEIAYKTLNKAELIAKKYDLLSILNEVYNYKIMYAHLNPKIDLKQLIADYNSNKKRLLEDEKLNLFYASVQAELHNSTTNVSDIINKNLKSYQISISQDLSYTALLKIIEISNEVAHASRDYFAVLSFIENACKTIQISERIEDKHLNAHLHILYYLANTYFRIKKFEVAKIHLKDMHYYMQLDHNRYYNTFYPQYQLLSNLLLIYTGRNPEAILALQEFNYNKFKQQPEYPLHLKLSLVVALFLNQDFKAAFKLYQEFHHSDTWYSKKTDNIWVVKKNLIEILLLIELDYGDLVEARLQSFKRKHKANILAKNEEKVLEFLKLAIQYYYDNNVVNTHQFQSKTKQLLKAQKQEEDVFSISFYAWLLAKIDHSDPYTLCLNLISQ
ncbi:MAG: hypothetical protein BM564_01650 [Bacteroidetes bacterium MedPE-SWsnd-G2]|nr:MAG: hypothetical protein BM564_01650 [Bacteroidetes bacterium MedPE-SWsnd-G2]